MASDKQPFQSLTGIAEQLAGHSMERAQGAMKNISVGFSERDVSGCLGQHGSEQEIIGYCTG
jgi:hypothetical protein